MYLPIGQCIFQYANYLPIVYAFANIYLQISFSISRYLSLSADIEYIYLNLNLHILSADIYIVHSSRRG